MGRFLGRVKLQRSLAALVENKARFLTSDLTNRNKKQRTLIVRRAGYPAGAALVGIGKTTKAKRFTMNVVCCVAFGNWLQMALRFGKNLGLFLPSPKTQDLCDFEKRSGVRIGLESLFRGNLFHQDHHLQYGSRPWWSMTGNSNWWVGIESSQSGMSLLKTGLPSCYSVERSLFYPGAQKIWNRKLSFKDKIGVVAQVEFLGWSSSVEPKHVKR